MDSRTRVKNLKMADTHRRGFSKDSQTIQINYVPSKGVVLLLLSRDKILAQPFSIFLFCNLCGQLCSGRFCQVQ